MVTSWIIAACSVATLLFGGGFSIVKFRMKVRADREEQARQQRIAAEAQATEALQIAREETKKERQKYEESLIRQIAELQEDLDNEQSAREVLQRRYEELLRETRNAT